MKKEKIISFINGILCIIAAVMAVMSGLRIQSQLLCLTSFLWIFNAVRSFAAAFKK